MEATTVIAIVGAATGTGSLAIQATSWWGGRTRLDLKVNPGTAEVVADNDGGGGQLMKQGEVVFVQITNKSPHPVKISHVGAVDAGDASRGYFVARPYPLHLTLPFEIPPRDNRTVWMLRDGMFDDRQLRFTAITTDGKTVRTRPLRIDDRPSLALVDLSS